MADHELRRVVHDLIAVLHDQAKQLELLVTHVEQVTRRLPQDQQFNIVASELSELRLRAQALVKGAAP
jgi:hypothetical protein